MKFELQGTFNLHLHGTVTSAGAITSYNGQTHVMVQGCIAVLVSALWECSRFEL